MKKNLLFIFADQWRRSAIGLANEDMVITPNIDSLAKNGVYFTNAVSSCPLCSPNRASLFTGKHPLSTGVFTNCKTGLSMKLSDNELTLGDILKQNNYATGYIGKWHLDEPELNKSCTPISKAKEWDAYTPPGKARHGFDFWHSYGACDEHLTPHYWSESEEQIKINEYSPKHETDIAIDFIQHNLDNPFALVLSWNPPHSPYDQVPEEYYNLYKNTEIRLRENVIAYNLKCHTGEEINYTIEQLELATKQYFAAISGLDAQLARLLQALDEHNLRDNTCIVLTSDHGDMMGSHGLMAKHIWYEESIGVPLILSGPDIKSSVCDAVISGADIMPTVLHWLNIDIPKSVQGIDKFNFIGNAEMGNNSEGFICACPGREVFLREFEKAGKNPQDFGWRAIRTKNYTYVIDNGYTPNPKTIRYLYDLKTDPYQKNPIVLAKAFDNEIAHKLENKLIEFLIKQSDNFISYIDMRKIDE